jgi:hypothetical protein
MSDTNLPKLPTGQVVQWNNDHLVSHYSNLMALSMSAFDISIIFGELGQASPETVEGIAKAKIILCPEQALNLMTLLSIAVQKFTEGNGPLRASAKVDGDAFKKAIDDSRVKTNER